MGTTVDQQFDLKHPDRLFIGGEWVGTSGSAVFDVVNPATEQVMFQVAEAQAKDIDRAMTAARDAFDDGPWPRLAHHERAQYVRAIGQGLRERADQIARIHASEMGILFRDAVYGPEWAAARYDYYADQVETFPFVERHVPRDGGKLSLLVREPVGVVGMIVPWNGALTIIAPKLAAALIAGCTVVLKAAAGAPGEPLVIAEIAEEIGLPPGVLNVVTAEREASELLVRDPRVDKISFTGSTTAGRHIASLVGARIGRLTLELGGKSAAVILDDYDVETAATELAAAGIRMTGQVCASLTRIVVPRKKHDAFAQALAAAMATVRIGDPFDPAVGMGPLASARQRETVERYMTIGQEQGADLVTGGGRPADLDRGFFVEPTVFANVDNSSTIAQEEIFGPVLSVIPADSEAQAVDIANDSIYGLNATVFSDDIDRAYDVARRLRSGTVGHNGFRSDFDVGFGGFKQSGIGRDGGHEGLYGYVEPKTVVLDDVPSNLNLENGAQQ